MYKFSIYEIIDERNQIIGRYTTRQLAERELEKINLPYKEFFKIIKSEVNG